MSEEDHPVDLNSAGMSSKKATSVAPAVQPQLEKTVEPDHTYDKSTLYVSSIPHNAEESEVKQIFAGYGHIKSIRLIPNNRQYIPPIPPSFTHSHL